MWELCENGVEVPGIEPGSKICPEADFTRHRIFKIVGYMR